MDNSDHCAFTAGVRPGGLTNTDEVLVLLCCLLTDAAQPVSFDQLRDALIGQELVNYFEFADMIRRMTLGGYADESEQGYIVTQFGRDTARECKYNLPVAVLERAGNALGQALLLQRRMRENTIDIVQEPSGWRVTIIINDMGEELLHFSAILPTQANCEEIKAGFLAAPSRFYTAIMTAAASGETNIKDGEDE